MNSNTTNAEKMKAMRYALKVACDAAKVARYAEKAARNAVKAAAQSCSKECIDSWVESHNERIPIDDCTGEDCPCECINVGECFVEPIEFLSHFIDIEFSGEPRGICWGCGGQAMPVAEKPKRVLTEEQKAKMKAGRDAAKAAKAAT